MRFVHFVFFLLLCTQKSDSSTQLGRYEFKLAEPDEPGLERLLERDARQGNYNLLAYSVQMIINPCLGHSPDCCMDRFGTPEYIRESYTSPTGWLWALGRNRDPYICQKPCFGVWQHLVETNVVYDWHFDFMEADETTVWAINFETESLFMRKLDGTTEWNYINGNIKHLSASSSHSVFVIERNMNSLLSCAKPCTGDWTMPTESEKHPNKGAIWREPDGGYTLKSVESDKTHIWLVMENGEIFMRRIILEEDSKIWEDITDGEWANISPIREVNFTLVSASTAGYGIWALDSSGLPYYCRKPCATAQWIEVTLPPGGSFAYLDADDVNVYGTTTLAGQIYKHPVDFENGASKWTTIPSTVDRSSATITAWKSFPDDGFRLATSSANPHPESKILSFYSVAEEGRICSGQTTEIMCNLKSDENCRWNIDSLQCEKMIPKRYSRLADEYVTFDDPNCVVIEIIDKNGVVKNQAGYSLVQEKENVKPEIRRDNTCAEHNVRKKLISDRPACWDHNETVHGDASCLDPEGNSHAFCLAVGYSSTAFIPQCGGRFKHDYCGTFIEVHKSGDNRTISRNRIPLDVSFTTGFRTMTVATSFHDLPDNEYMFGFSNKDLKTKVICKGEYELWWVQYTRGRRIVERIKKFYVTFPDCDWDPDSGRYLDYYVV